MLTQCVYTQCVNISNYGFPRRLAPIRLAPDLSIPCACKRHSSQQYFCHVVRFSYSFPQFSQFPILRIASLSTAAPASVPRLSSIAVDSTILGPLKPLPQYLHLSRSRSDVLSRSRHLFESPVPDASCARRLLRLSAKESWPTIRKETR